ncbi:MAG: SDR family NAD(P)-dependent oxidoreductase [Actinomycetes bacterium]
MTSTTFFAVVTGASSGIGLELARQFAENGFDVLICAEDAGITAAAAELSSTGSRVSPLRADLSTYEGVETLYAAAASTGRPIDALALNAGIGLGGPFVETDLTTELRMIDLNVKSTVHLTKLALPDMVRRNEGKILITSSIASTMPGAFQTVYNATKSFLQSFAQALQNELKETGVTVTSLMPGPTDTEFFERAEMEDTRVGQGKKDDPAPVATQGFTALMKGEDKVIAGSLKTKAMGAANKILPDSVKAEEHRQMAEPGSGQ